MATYKRWRRGTVIKIKDGEYRVGPVPPKNGITGYERAHLGKGMLGPGKIIPIYAKITQLATPEPQDIINALNKITTKHVYVSCYIVKASGDIKKPTFKWTSKIHGSTITAEIKRDMTRMIHGLSPIKSMTEYAIASLPLDYPTPLVVAWNFLEA